MTSPFATSSPVGSVTSTSTVQRFFPRRTTRALAVRSTERAALVNVTLRDTVVPRRFAGGVSVYQLAAIAAVSTSVEIAPPWTVSPIVISGSEKGSVSSA